MAALGKPSWTYLSDARVLVEQNAETSDPAPSRPVYARGYVVEYFGLRVNRMLASLARSIVVDPNGCLRDEEVQRCRLPRFNDGGLRSAASYILGKRNFQYIYLMSDLDWLGDPQAAYDEWQRNEAVGADRRPFAEQSITQHRSMFARFHRHLATNGKTVATFGSAEIDNFFNALAREARPDTTTQLRYLKLIDRVSRHLVAMDVRKDNPASSMLVGQAWPEDEPTPIFLSEANDKRLQGGCVAPADATFKELRSVAIVALFLGTGITSAECRQLDLDDLNVDGLRPDVYIEKRGPRIARRVPLEPFCVEVLREYVSARHVLACPTRYLFVATATGKPMKDDTLGKCVRSALGKIDLTAADMSPRLLRNTYGRRHIAAGSTNEQASNLLGLSSHRTAARLRQTLDLTTEQLLDERAE